MAAASVSPIEERGQISRHDNLTPGTKDSSIPLTTPVPDLTAASSFLN
ncbi:hypothetical protein [Clostridium transplantifaecale]|nr:hypothetical protein [Clostridium transplantifaecale]